jgi:hypothetical protein
VGWKLSAHCFQVMGSLCCRLTYLTLLPSYTTDYMQRTALKQGHVWANQLQLPTTGSPAWWRAHCNRFYPPTRQQSSSERMQARDAIHDCRWVACCCVWCPACGWVACWHCTGPTTSCVG